MLKKNLVEVIYNVGKFERLNTTLLQTKEIVDYNKAINVNADDVVTIVNLKRGFLLILTSEEQDIIRFSKQVNAITAREDTFHAGETRTGEGVVSILADNFSLSLKTEEKINEEITEILTNKSNSETNRALDLFLYMMKNKIFWDGNERTAIVTVNHYMNKHGLGLLVIPESKFIELNKYLDEFYNNDEKKEEIMQYMYENCIFGIDYLKE